MEKKWQNNWPTFNDLRRPDVYFDAKNTYKRFYYMYISRQNLYLGMALL